MPDTPTTDTNTDNPISIAISVANGDDTIQILGHPDAMFSGAKPVMRELTLADIEDDCPACQANRALIEAGTPPMALVYETPEAA